MIILYRKCLLKQEMQEKKWDKLPAFLFFSKYKNVYVNGKPLKWYTIFKNGDVIEVVERPQGIGAFIVGAIAKIGAVLSATAVTVAGVSITYGAILGTVAVVGLAVVASRLGQGLGGFGGVGTDNANTDATETKPEIKGANNTVSTNIIPVVYGKTRQTPFYGQLPYRLTQDGGATNIYRQYFIANTNNIVISDEKFGETPLSDYSVDYVDSTKSFGGSVFIGYDNVKSVQRDEQLSINTDEQVNQNSIVNYNQSTTSTTLEYNFEMQFSNVVIGSWANKTFNILFDVLDDLSSPVELTQDFTITSGDLTLVSGDVYTYSGTHTFTQDITYLTQSTFSPVTDTRGNSEEIASELDSLYIDEEVITDDFSSDLTLNRSVNKYLGTVSEVVETSPSDTTEIDVVISFPQGLYKQENDGSRISRSTKIDIQYKTQTGTYQDLDTATLKIRDLDGVLQDLSTSTTTVSGSVMTVYSPSDISQADELFFRTITLVLPKDTYSVRVKSADLVDKTTFDIGTPVCSEFDFYIDGDVLDESILPDVNQIALEATAYKGLSGTLKKYNYLAEAKINIWDGTDWDTIDKTSNPAAIIRDILTNDAVNPRAEDITALDNDSLVELYNWCETEGFEAYTLIVDQSKILDIVAQILINCQATFTRLGGKYVFVIDNEGKTPVGLFGQHNSFNFKWTPTMGRVTEAIRASYVNIETNTQDEFTAYWYNNQVNYTPETGKVDSDYLIIKTDYNYVNDIDIVKKIVEYELTTTQTKRNNFEFQVNLEALNLELFDRIYVSNTCDMSEESTGRIKSLITSGGNITGFQLYTPIEISENSSITIRSLDYINEMPVVNIYSVTNSGNSDIINISPIVNDGVIKGQGTINGKYNSWYYDGDLFSVGVATPYDCVVTNIRYNDDLTATITCREY